MKKLSPALLASGFVIVCLLMLGSFYLGRTQQSTSKQEAPTVASSILSSPSGVNTSTPDATTIIATPSSITESKLNFVWLASSQNIPEAELPALKKGISILITQTGSNKSQVVIKDAIVKSPWGVLYGEEKVNDFSSNSSGSPIVLLAHKNKDNWEILNSSDPRFCQIL